MRHVKRLLTMLVVVLAVGIGFSVPAFADPTSTGATLKTLTPEQRVKLAQDACAEAPGGWAMFDFASPRTICENTIKLVIERDGQVTAATLCGALTFSDQDLMKQCSTVVQPVVAAAQQALGAIAEGINEVAECAPGVVTGEWYECVSKKVHLGLAQAANDTWSLLGQTVTRDTAAISILDLTSNTGSAKAFREVYIDVATLSMPIALIAGLISIITATLQRRGRPLWNMLSGAVIFGLFWAGSLTFAALALKAGDGLALLLAGENGSKLQLDQGGMARLMDSMTTALPSTLNTGNLMWLVMTAVLFIGILVQMVILALREVSLPLIAVVIPVALALQAGPEAVRKALPRLAAAFLTIVVAKPLMVLALRLANAFLQAALDKNPTSASTDLWPALLGTVTLFMALFFTGAIYKLFNLATSEAGRRGGGSLFNLGQSAANLGGGGGGGGNMAQQAATANRLQSGSAAAGGAKAAAAGGAAGALPVVGLGIAAVAGAGAAMRGVVSQGASAGGALEDAEGVTLPPMPPRHGGGSSDRSSQVPPPSHTPSVQTPAGQNAAGRPPAQPAPGSSGQPAPQAKGNPEAATPRTHVSQTPPPPPPPPPPSPGYNPTFSERKTK